MVYMEAGRSGTMTRTKRVAKIRQPAAPAASGQTRASESEEIVHAIRWGKIDALVTAGTRGDEVLILQGAEHPYRVLVEAVHDGVATLDASGTVLYANPRFAEILGSTVEGLVGTRLENHLPRGQFEKLKPLFGQATQNQEKRSVVLEGINGKGRIARFVVNPTNPTNSSTQSSVYVVATELTELHEANKALVSNEESLRQLSARLLQLQDEERRHIARDLHDITGQKLVIQSMQLSQVLRENRPRLNPGARRMLSECAALTKEISGEIRTLSYLLHPPLLDELGLPAAAKWYAEGFQKRTGIAVEVDIPRDLPRLQAEVEMSLFRVVQESLTNVHRYAESPKAVVRIELSSEQLRLEVCDFGKGIKPGMRTGSHESTRYLGVGIQGMRERMKQLRGKLEIFSQPNQGTQVVATLPLLGLLEPTEQIPIFTPDPSGASVTEPVKAPEARKRIVVADDHEVLRQGLRTMLEAQNEWDVCGEAANGKDAVEMVLALKPDLVILDINMPVLNGLAAVREILRRQPETKILVFTVHESIQTVREIRAAGAHGYLAKNKAGRDLLRLVRELLAASQGLLSPQSPRSGASTASQKSYSWGSSND